MEEKKKQYNYVVTITGLSGVGKTTYATEMYDILEKLFRSKFTKLFRKYGKNAEATKEYLDRLMELLEDTMQIEPIRKIGKQKAMKKMRLFPIYTLVEGRDLRPGEDRWYVPGVTDDLTSAYYDDYASRINTDSPVGAPISGKSFDHYNQETWTYTVPELEQYISTMRANGNIPDDTICIWLVPGTLKVYSDIFSKYQDGSDIVTDVGNLYLYPDFKNYVHNAGRVNTTLDQCLRRCLPKLSKSVHLITQKDLTQCVNLIDYHGIFNDAAFAPEVQDVVSAGTIEEMIRRFFSEKLSEEQQTFNGMLELRTYFEELNPTFKQGLWVFPDTYLAEDNSYRILKAVQGIVEDITERIFSVRSSHAKRFWNNHLFVHGCLHPFYEETLYKNKK